MSSMTSSTKPPSQPADDEQANEQVAEPTPKLDAMRRAAAHDPKDKGPELDNETIMSATDWFLSDEDDEDITRTFELNVGVGKDKWVRWTVRALDRDRIRDLRKLGMSRATRRSGGEADDMRVNLLIATEGSVVDFTDPRVRSYKANDGTVGELIAPEDVLRYRFRKKPGLIDQIAGEVLSTSGYDDDDVREVAAASG